jgi:transcriptional regulator with XRE-family HTH domain
MARAGSQKARQILARNVRRLRLDQGLTQEALANAANLRQGFISDLESAKLDVRIDSLDRLAKAMAVRVSDLFDETKRN